VGDERALLNSRLCRNGGGIDQSAVRSIPAPLNEDGGPLRGVAAIPLTGRSLAYGPVQSVADRGQGREQGGATTALQYTTTRTAGFDPFLLRLSQVVQGSSQVWRTRVVYGRNRVLSGISPEIRAFSPEGEWIPLGCNAYSPWELIGGTSRCPMKSRGTGSIDISETI
jgi:hypothetical protein